MATYSIKLADHTDSSDEVKMRIKTPLKIFYDRVFAGTSDDAIVDWGTALATDTIVLHFVADVPSSYIVKTMGKGKPINQRVGGHTRLHHRIICSEFYRTVLGRQGPRTFSGFDYARLAFHESLHNVWPGWDENDLRGHGGLAETPVGPDLNDWDADTFRRGIAIKSVATQQL
jgi:hypothetical protein